MASQRIVSLVPSLTGALFAFVAGERIVGRTRYCLWPPGAVGRVPAVGDPREWTWPVSRSLTPTSSSRNNKESVEKIQAAGVPVFVGVPQSVEGAIWLLRELVEAHEVSSRYMKRPHNWRNKPGTPEEGLFTEARKRKFSEVTSPVCT